MARTLCTAGMARSAAYGFRRTGGCVASRWPVVPCVAKHVVLSFLPPVNWNILSVAASLAAAHAVGCARSIWGWIGMGQIGYSVEVN